MTDRTEIPASLLEEAERQRVAEIGDLERRIEALRALPPEGWLFDFNEASPSLHLAVSTALRLDRSGWRSARNLERVIFRPPPCKGDGAWLVRVSFARGGPCAGQEWYGTRAELSRAWEDSIREWRGSVQEAGR
jgi:hypothetical protein